MIDIFTDPIMGWLNDRNLFSRKVWLFFGGSLALFALKKLFLIDSLPYESYLLIWISVLYVGWTIFQIPYLSIGYDLERDYFLRTKLSANREFFILLGLFISLGAPLVFKMNSYESIKLLTYIAFFSGLFGLIFL